MSDKASDITVALIKYVVGPLLAFALAKGCSDANHAKSAKGYEVVASSLNDVVDHQLSDLERRLEAVEKTAPASMPTSWSTTQVLDSIRAGKGVDHAHRRPARAPRKQLVPKSLDEAAK